MRKLKLKLFIFRLTGHDGRKFRTVVLAPSKAAAGKFVTEKLIEVTETRSDDLGAVAVSFIEAGWPVWDAETGAAVVAAPAERKPAQAEEAQPELPL